MKFRTSEYFVREVFVSLKRNNWMSFASIGTVAVSLFVLGVFLLLVLNMNRMASTLESQVQISVYLQDELKGAEKDELEERISDLSGIQSVKYVDRDEAIERFRERLGDQKYLLDALGDKNPLPDSFEVTVMQPSMVQTAAETIAQFDGVAEAFRYHAAHACVRTAAHGASGRCDDLHHLEHDPVDGVRAAQGDCHHEIRGRDGLVHPLAVFAGGRCARLHRRTGCGVCASELLRGDGGKGLQYPDLFPVDAPVPVHELCERGDPCFGHGDRRHRKYDFVEAFPEGLIR